MQPDLALLRTVAETNVSARCLVMLETVGHSSLQSYLCALRTVAESNVFARCSRVLKVFCVACVSVVPIDLEVFTLRSGTVRALLDLQPPPLPQVPFLA